MKNKQKEEIKRTSIGGQALIEGVMMRGSRSLALAVRDGDGDILVETQRLKPKNKLQKIPVIRGVLSFVSSLAVGISTLMRSAEMTGGEDEKLSKGAMAFSVVFAMVLALGIFFFLPGLVADTFYNRVFQNVLVKNLVSGVIRISLFIGYLFLVTLLKDIKRTFMYHGAEHKTINCYEKGLDLTIENIKTCSKRHNRCGTTFLFLVMLISILVFAFVEFGLNYWLPLTGYARTFAYMGIKLAFLPLVAGLSYEVLFLFAKLPDNWFSKILRAPGLALQKLTTKEPDEQMIEVALTAFTEVLIMDSDLSIEPSKYDKIPLKNALSKAEKELNKLNAEPVEAVWMLCYILSCRRNELNSFNFIGLKDYKKLEELLKQRKKMPLDYCLGLSNFCGYDIKVDKRVLIPRFETEILAETAVKLIGEREIDVLDLCCGSGCISVALARQTRARITAADISEQALEVANLNLEGLNVKIIQSDLFSAFYGLKFDMVIVNPPYIKSGEIDTLQPEVKAQPHIALDGGTDGLDFYRRLAATAAGHLNQGGILLLEAGINQAEAVAGILSDTKNYKNIESVNDLSGIERIVKAEIK